MVRPHQARSDFRSRTSTAQRRRLTFAGPQRRLCGRPCRAGVWLGVGVTVASGRVPTNPDFRPGHSFLRAAFVQSPRTRTHRRPRRAHSPRPLFPAVFTGGILPLRSGATGINCGSTDSSSCTYACRAAPLLPAPDELAAAAHGQVQRRPHLWPRRSIRVLEESLFGRDFAWLFADHVLTPMLLLPGPWLAWSGMDWAPIRVHFSSSNGAKLRPEFCFAGNGSPSVTRFLSRSRFRTAFYSLAL